MGLGGEVEAGAHGAPGGLDVGVFEVLRVVVELEVETAARIARRAAARVQVEADLV